MTGRSLRRIVAAGLFAATALASGALLAGPERVPFPADYQTKFVRYNSVERPDRKPPVVRFFYANPESFAAMRAGMPAPNGTVLVMEDRKAALGPDGNPLLDDNGRWIATDEVVAVAVQEKRAGWGEAYAPDKRNGDWEYSAFNAKGEMRPNLKTDSCFTCHLNRTKSDYTFTYLKFFADTRK
ncbi:MAG: cytochrome P460 family protein [Alphaproteobacteria bacterium]